MGNTYCQMAGWVGASEGDFDNGAKLAIRDPVAEAVVMVGCWRRRETILLLQSAS